MGIDAPTGWTASNLGTVCAVIYRYPAFYGSNIDIVEQGVPVLRGEHITNGATIDTTPGYWSVSAETSAAFPKTVLLEGDVVMAVRGTVGRFAQIGPAETGFQISPNLIRLSPDGSLVAPLYFRHSVNWAVEWLKQRAQQQALPALNAKDIKDAPVPLPPLSEQKKIAAILSSVDNAIQKTQQVVDQTRQVKKGLLQELLTKGIGRDGRPHTRFKKTPIGMIPEEWEVRLLDEVATRGSGHTPNKKHPEYWDGGIPWVSLADTFRLDQVHVNETTSTISNLGLANSSAVLHPRGTVFVSRDASVGRSAIASIDLAVSQHFIAWQCGPRLQNMFLYYYLQLLKPVLENIAVGSTIKTIGLGFFKKLAVPLPPMHEQRVIGQRLFTCDQVLVDQAETTKQLRVTKAGLLQDLLTGKVRVTP